MVSGANFFLEYGLKIRVSAIRFLFLATIESSSWKGAAAEKIRHGVRKPTD